MTKLFIFHVISKWLWFAYTSMKKGCISTVIVVLGWGTGIIIPMLPSNTVLYISKANPSLILKWRGKNPNLFDRAFYMGVTALCNNYLLITSESVENTVTSSVNTVWFIFRKILSLKNKCKYNTIKRIPNRTAMAGTINIESWSKRCPFQSCNTSTCVKTLPSTGKTLNMESVLRFVCSVILV